MCEPTCIHDLGCKCKYYGSSPPRSHTCVCVCVCVCMRSCACLWYTELACIPDLGRKRADIRGQVFLVDHTSAFVCICVCVDACVGMCGIQS